VLDETFGLGPLEALLKDASISDILINGPKSIYVERRGKLERSSIQFRDNSHLMQVIDRIVSRVGRRGRRRPMVTGIRYSRRANRWGRCSSSPAPRRSAPC